MDIVTHNCWSLPNEILVDILSLVSSRSVLNFEASSKTHPQRFEERDIYQLLECRLCHWNAADAKEAAEQSEKDTKVKINWRAEFTLSYLHASETRANVLVANTICNPFSMTLMPAVSPNHLKYQVVRGLAPQAQELPFLFQSNGRLYPLPIGDFTVAYYEITIVASIQKTDDEPWLSVGVALAEYASLTGVGRNSFAYTDRGHVLMELATAPCEYPPINTGDTIGFGMDFTKRSIFFTLNGQFVCEKTKNYRDMKLLNLETLHATVTCRHGLELKANFGARPFVYDVAQYYRQRSLSEKSTKKLTFSVVMLMHLRKYVEEETLEAIENNELQCWSMLDANQPKTLPTSVNSFWLHLLYPRSEPNGIGGLLDLALFESLMINRDLFSQWKDNKSVRNFIKEVAQAGNAPWSEARESVEEVLDKIHNHASFAFSAALNDLIDRNYETVIRRDVIRECSAPGWVPMVTAYKLLATTQLPVDHFVIQACVHFLSASLGFELKDTYGEEDIKLAFTSTMQYIIGLRANALSEIILETNKSRKETFMTRNAILKNFYNHRLPKEILDDILDDSKIPTPPPKIRDTTHEEERMHCLVPNLIALEHFDQLEQTAKCSTVVESLCFHKIPDEDLTEAQFIKLVKKQIHREISTKKLLKLVEELKENILKPDRDPNVLPTMARLLGIDPNLPTKTLVDRVTKELDQKIKQLSKERLQQKKKRTKDQSASSSSLSTELLIGSSIGIVVGLGVAFFMYRWRQK